MMKNRLKNFIYIDFNEEQRNRQLEKVITQLPTGLKILDAGAGQLKNKKFCSHLKYVSQDFGEYEGSGDGQGLQTGTWDTSNIDIICDITSIPDPACSYDAILCGEVLEHIPEPAMALNEFYRLLKVGGKLILTAPFASLVHFVPYHFCSGFSRYWYEHHLNRLGFKIEELPPNGDWFEFCHQEIARLGNTSRKYGELLWPLAYLLSLAGTIFFKLRGRKKAVASDLCCFGWHCIATKIKE